MMAEPSSLDSQSATTTSRALKKTGIVTPLSLDLSDLPGLIQPAPPSNTLLVTRLSDPRIFSPTTLAHLRSLIASHCYDDLYSFTPLPSFSRIIITFHSTESAITVRQKLDGESIFSQRMRVFFGQNTSIADLEKSASERQLRVPKSEKQFFISPPPSPPHGWQSKDEDPPNKEVHAEDLASALARISRRADAAPSSPTSQYSGIQKRSRSNSTLLFDPNGAGHSPDLPAIAVIDTTVSPRSLSPGAEDLEGSVLDTMTGKRILAHTSRPPVELMSDL